MAIQPLPIAPDLLAGNWVGEDENQWLTAATRAIGAGQQAGNDGVTLTTTARGVDDTLNGQTGNMTVDRLRQNGNTKHNLSGQYQGIAAIYQQAGQNVYAAKTAQNNILTAYQTADAANTASATAGNWSAARAAAESLRLRNQTRTALAGVNGQFKTAQNALLADMHGKRPPGKNSRMPGSENAPDRQDGTRTPATPTPGTPPPGGNNNTTTPGGLDNVLSTLLGTNGNGSNTSGLNTAMTLMQTFMPIAMGLLTAGMGLVTSGVSALTGNGGGLNNTTGSPYGIAGMNGLGTNGLGTNGLGTTTTTGSPLGSLLGQGATPTPGTTTAPANTQGVGADHGRPRDPIGAALKDAETRVKGFLGGKERVGIVRDNGDGTHKVETIGLDGKTRSEVLGAPHSGPEHGASNIPPKSPDTAPPPDNNSHDNGNGNGNGNHDSNNGNGNRDNGNADNTPKPEGGTPRTMPAANDTSTAAPAPTDHPTVNPADQRYGSEGVPSTLSSFDPRSASLPTMPTANVDAPHLPTHQMGTGLTSAAPSAAPIAPIDPTPGAATHAPAAAAAQPMAPMSPMGGGMMPPAAAMGGGAAAASGGGGAHPVQQPSVSIADSPTTHGPITPVRGEGASHFPSSGPAGYLAMLPQPKALAHTKLAAIAASQDGMRAWQPAAIGVFERDGVLTFVYASVDGLGFIPEGVELPAGVRTLSELAMGDPLFFTQWGGYRDPIPKLRAFEYSRANLVGQLVTAVAMDTADETCIQTREQKEAIGEAKLLAPLSIGRRDFGSTFSIGDLADALRTEYSNMPAEYKYSPAQAHTELVAARWGENDGHSRYPWVWRAYLIISARAAIENGDLISAQYLVAEVRRSGPLPR